MKNSVLVLVASVLWSSVTMSQPAKAYRLSTWQVLNLPAEELRRLETEGPKPAHIPARIDIRTIPPASQFAMISISGHPLCVAMTTKLRASTARFNVHDFAVLRQLGLVQRIEGLHRHRLTDDGKAYAHQVAIQIAQEMGVHEIWSSGSNNYFRTTHCTCGWSTRLYSRRFDAGTDHSERIARHLSEAAQATRPPG